MRYAIVGDTWKEANEPGMRGLCPGCLTPVYSRCPAIGLPHWVHFSKTMCAGVTEPMTDWHRDWQGEYPEDCREVPVVRRGKRHVADVLVNDYVLEFQHSRITGPDIVSREKTYREMAWIIDASEYGVEFHPLDDGDGTVVGRWEFIGTMLERYYYKCDKPLMLDIGNEQVIYVTDIQKRGVSFSGGCELLPRPEFVDRSMSDWIRQLAPVTRPPKEIRAAIERVGRDAWNDGELGDVCEGTKAAFEAAKQKGLLEQIREQQESGLVDRKKAMESDSYYKFGM